MAPTGIDNERVPLKFLRNDTVRPARNEFSLSKSVALSATSGKRYKWLQAIFGKF